jgi:hypothetical protein
MKRLFLVVTLALGLAGCAAMPSLQIGTAVTFNTLEGVEAAYGVALNFERQYKALPLCKTGTLPSTSNICARRSIIVRLQAADRQAIVAIAAAANFVRRYPNVDPSNVIGAASSAVAVIQTILSNEAITAGVK